MTMNTRRDFLRTSLFGASALALLDRRGLLAAPAAASGAPPMRFVFLHRGNGLWPKVMVPPSFDKPTMEKERRKEAYSVDLDGHELPAWLQPVAKHVDQLTLLQGLSGKMCMESFMVGAKQHIKRRSVHVKARTPECNFVGTSRQHGQHPHS